MPILRLYVSSFLLRKERKDVSGELSRYCRFLAITIDDDGQYVGLTDLSHYKFIL